MLAVVPASLVAVTADNAALVALVVCVLIGGFQVLVEAGLLLAIVTSEGAIGHSSRLRALGHHVSLLTFVKLDLKDGVTVFR